MFLKMYILVKDSVPNGFAILAAAHASLACYLKFKVPGLGNRVSGGEVARRTRRHDRVGIGWGGGRRRLQAARGLAKGFQALSALQVAASDLL